MRSAADAPRAARLGLLIGETRWLVDLADAGEIVPVPAIAPVPLTRDWFRGLANLRGSLVSVADLSRFAGGPFTPLDKESRLLALAPRLQFNAALLVSRMLGLRGVDGMQAAAPAPDAPAWDGGTWTDASGLAWRELRLAGLPNDERFLLVAR